MAGILANSASKAMVSGDTATTNTVSGYVKNERVTLGTSPAGTVYAWTLSRPSGSTAIRAALTDDDVAAPTFMPDVEGEYIVTVNVDGTIYRLTATVLDVAISNTVQLLRLAAIADSQVPTPAGTTVYLYNSSTQGKLTMKKSDGTRWTINITAV